MWLVYRVLVVCCGALYGVWWRLVAFRVAGCVASRLLSSRCAFRVASRLSSFRVACCGAGRLFLVSLWRGVGRRGCRPVCRVGWRGVRRSGCFMWKLRGAGPVFSVSVFYPPPAPGEGVQSRFCRWWAFFALKWGTFFLVFLSFSIWFSTLKNPRGLFFPRGCSLYGCDGGYWMRRRESISAAMFSAVSSVRNWISSSSMYVMLVSFSCVWRSG